MLIPPTLPLVKNSSIILFFNLTSLFNGLQIYQIYFEQIFKFIAQISMKERPGQYLRLIFQIIQNLFN